MTLNKVTSLADLEFRAKTDKYYKQLVMLTANRSRVFKFKTYRGAIDYLHRISAEYDPHSCSLIVLEVNYNCDKIVEEVEAAPVVETTTPTPTVVSVAELKKILLKKKATTKKIAKKTTPGTRRVSRRRLTRLLETTQS